MAKLSFRRDSDAPRARRFTELLLLVVAVGISSFSMYLIDPEHALDTSKSQWLPCTIVLGAGSLLIHLVLQFRARYADPFILPLVVALNGIGLTMIYRLDPQIAAPVGDGQLMWTGVSMVLCAVIVFVLRDHRVLRKVTYTSLVLSMILLIMPMIPGLGMELNGARIWIHIGNRTFQPGEVAKITLAIFFAGYLATHRDLILVAGRRIGPVNLPRLRDLAPVFLAREPGCSGVPVGFGFSHHVLRFVHGDAVPGDGPPVVAGCGRYWYRCGWVLRVQLRFARARPHLRVGSRL